MIEHPPCPICGSPVVQRLGEATWSYVERRGCSTKCSNVLRSNTRFKCPVCGEERNRFARTCGKEECRDADSQKLSDVNFPPDYFADNVPDDIDRYGSLPLRPLARTMGGVARTW